MYMLIKLFYPFLFMVTALFCEKITIGVYGKDEKNGKMMIGDDI